MKKKVSVVITDVDNTLYDWVGIWHASFSAMLECLVSRSGVSRDTLIREFKGVHEAHGTSEYTFSIEELPSLLERHASCDLPGAYVDCIKAYRDARKACLRLYPSVTDTLTKLRDSGCLLVAHTESKAFYTRYRMKALDLDLLFDYLYSPPDDEIPGGKSRGSIRYYPDGHCEMRKTIQKSTPEGETKPNPAGLKAILAEIGADREKTVYVGDDLVKDISMARDAGVTSIWAAYGTAHERPEYELLKQVTHWNPKAVKEQQVTSAETVKPWRVLRSGFGELLDVVEPEQFIGGGAHCKREEGGA